MTRLDAAGRATPMILQAFGQVNAKPASTS
jgi:hypothetical protein